MTKVRFTAKAGLPADKGGKRWLHRKASWVTAGSGRRLVGPVYFESGQAYEVSQSDLDWLLALGPSGCFKEVAEQAKPKSKPKESDE